MLSYPLYVAINKLVNDDKKHYSVYLKLMNLLLTVVRTFKTSSCWSKVKSLSDRTLDPND